MECGNAAPQGEDRQKPKQIRARAMIVRQAG
jgi:hypothetical protein